MGTVIVLVLLLVLVFWLAREFSSAGRRQAFLATRDGRGRPLPPPHQRADEPAIDQRVQMLRAAVARGDVTFDEAAGSLIRFAGGGMTVDQAGARLRRR